MSIQKVCHKMSRIFFVIILSMTVTIVGSSLSGNIYAASAKLSKKEIKMAISQSEKIKIKGTKKKAVWSSSNFKVASVKKGIITAKKRGKATITAKIGNKKLYCKVTVKNVKLSKRNLSLKVTQNTKLKVIGTKKKAKWNSSNKNIATVKNGIVTGKKQGKTTITARIGSMKLKCNVIVNGSDTDVNVQPTYNVNQPVQTNQPPKQPKEDDDIVIENFDEVAAYGERDGCIVINAADAIENKPYAYCNNTTLKSPKAVQEEFLWEITESYENDSNKMYKGISLTPERDSQNPDTDEWIWPSAEDVSDAPSLCYKVFAEEEGEYYFSFYSNSPSTDSDSFHVGVNGWYEFSTTDVMSGGSDNNHAAVGACWFYCDKQPVYLDKGVNTLNIWGKESGICLRQLMLSKEKPMPARYLYFESQKNTEWLQESELITGSVTYTVPKEINLEYGQTKDITIDAHASNGAKVKLSAVSSTDAVEVSDVTNGTFRIVAKKGGYSTITVTAKAKYCTTVVKTFFVNTGYRMEGNVTSKAPQNLRVAPATETSDSITVVWSKPKDYTEIVWYDVYVNGEKAAEREPGQTHYTAEQLNAGSEYSFYVEANYSDGTFEASQTLYAHTDATGVILDITQAPYNAAGDGKQLDTEAIQQAIDDCPYGGTVLIPEGKVFLTGALNLKSHMTLKVEGELKGSENPNDYMNPDVSWDDDELGERIMSRFEGWELMCLRSLLNVGYLNWQNRSEVTCEDVTICGNGKITGGGTALQTASIKMAEDNNWYVGTTNRFLRSRGFLINIVQSKYVNLSGVHISDSPCWTVHMIYSDTVTTHGVEITSTIINGDGWDPDSSRNLMLFDSKIVTGDDCVAIKSGKNPEGDKVNIPTENVEIFDLHCTGGHGLAMGSEISGGINNINIHDCTVSNTLYGLQLKGTEKRGGGITNLYVQDCKLNLLLIKSNVGYNADGEPAEDVPIFSGLTFRNVEVEGTIEIAGFDKTYCHNHYVNDTLFENVTLGSKSKPNSKIVMEYCDGLKFLNVRKYNGDTPEYQLNKKNYNILVDDNNISE